MDDMKLFAKEEKGLETVIQVLSICRQDIVMEFGIDYCAMLKMRSGNRQITIGISK